MRPFNLAEARITERSLCKETVVRRLKIIAALVATTVLVGVVCYGCGISARNSASRLKSELADVQSRCTRIRKELNEIKVSVSRRKWQEQLSAGSRQWLGVLDALLSRVPPDIWLSKVENSEESSSILVEGEASSYDSLASFIGSLGCSSQFPEVNITTTRVRTIAGRRVVDFALQVKTRLPAGTAPAESQALSGLPGEPRGMPQQMAGEATQATRESTPLPASDKVPEVPESH
jgi:Tfp pilus assembly protein PilN